MAPQRERRPLDVFDPTGDGHAPHTLAEVIQRGQDVLDSIDMFHAALYGCMTPLALSGEEREMIRARKRIQEEVLDPLRKAQDILELDLPLATASALGAVFGDTWAPPEGSWGTLSPEEILEVRLRSRQVGPEERTTYRVELDKQPKIPGLIRRQRRREERAAREAAMTDEEKAARRERRLQGMRRGPKPLDGAGRPVLYRNSEQIPDNVDEILADAEPQPESAQEQVDRMNREMAAELDAVMEGRTPDTNHFG